MIAETTGQGWFTEYVSLLRDPAHILLELTLILIFDVAIGMMLLPFAKRWLKNHDKIKHGVHEPKTLTESNVNKDTLPIGIQT
jgi:hypothetical protein